jgi:hypothetical protein
VRRARRLVLGLWSGMLVTVGAISAPVLFIALPERALAGRVAGLEFRVVALVSLLLALLLALMEPRTVGRPRRFRVLVPAALLALMELIHPLVERARGDADAFALWHGLATLLYVLAAGLVLALWVEEERRG